MRAMHRREAIGALAAGCAGLAFGAAPAFSGKAVIRTVRGDIPPDALASGYGALGEIGETPNAAMSADERKVFRAVGRAQRQTNLPIFTHNAYGTGPNVPTDAGLTQLSVLESAGVNPNRVAVGHTCC